MTCWRHVVDKSATKSLKLVTDLLDLSVHVQELQETTVWLEICFRQVSDFSAQNLSVTVFDKIEIVEFGLYCVVCKTSVQRCWHNMRVIVRV